VLRARQRATLSVAMGAHEPDTLRGPTLTTRPLSAPITRTERTVAKHKTDIPFSLNQL